MPDIERVTVCELIRPADSILLNRPWLSVLAHMLLNRRERVFFAGSHMPPAAALAWLLGRAVAKDAVRLHGHSELCMADVDITSDPQGKPVVHLSAGTAPLVSLAHKNMMAVAAAADPDAFGGIGIDLEARRAMDPGVVADAFTPAELKLIGKAADDAGIGLNDGYLSVWCAKEAAGKALGTGVVGGPRQVEAHAVDLQTGRIRLRLLGPMAEIAAGHPAAPGPQMEAYARTRGEYVVALCLMKPARSQEARRS